MPESVFYRECAFYDSSNTHRTLSGSGKVTKHLSGVNYLKQCMLAVRRISVALGFCFAVIFVWDTLKFVILLPTADVLGMQCDQLLCVPFHPCKNNSSGAHALAA
jgi:hypothetical protein